MSDYEFIKGFMNIKLSNICKELKVSQSNVSNGSVNPKTMRDIKKRIIRELLMLMIQYKGEDFILMSLYNDTLEKLEEENQMLREML